MWSYGALARIVDDVASEVRAQGARPGALPTASTGKILKHRLKV